jgi:hypothetical protein
VQVPVIFSFAIAPAVFLFLHVYTLIRYDMLAANLRQFRTDLQASVSREADRERCRQLLANVEFVEVRTAPRTSALHSRLYPLVAWLVLAGFPIATLVAVQISSLRYQSNTVNRTQQVCLPLDLILLAWFFYRQRQRGASRFRFRWLRDLIPSLLAVVILAVDLIYLNVPGRGEQTVRAGDNGVEWREAYKQPLDLVLCPALNWGCRYLTLNHRTLVAHVWNPQSIADLRAEHQADFKKPLTAIEGVFLRERMLRFANFDESALYGAHMGGAHLTWAHFVRADLTGAHLSAADLTHAILAQANLTGATSPARTSPAPPYLGLSCRERT